MMCLPKPSIAQYCTSLTESAIPLEKSVKEKEAVDIRDGQLQSSVLFSEMSSS